MEDKGVLLPPGLGSGKMLSWQGSNHEERPSPPIAATTTEGPPRDFNLHLSTLPRTKVPSEPTHSS